MFEGAGGDTLRGSRQLSPGEAVSPFFRRRLEVARIDEDGD